MQHTAADCKLTERGIESHTRGSACDQLLLGSFVWGVLPDHPTPSPRGPQVAELHIILAISALLLWYGLTWPAAAALGLFFQQSGWCSHCFLHQAVFDDYRWNYLVGRQPWA